MEGGKSGRVGAERAGGGGGFYQFFMGVRPNLPVLC